MGRLNLRKSRNYKNKDWNELGEIQHIDEICQHIHLKPNMKVLDLGCRSALSSIYLAKTYDVDVVAHDLWTPATDNYQSIKKFNLEHKVIPLHGDSHQLPFAEEYFDVIFSMDPYHYFQTSNRYLLYILKFLKTGGILIIGASSHDIPYSVKIMIKQLDLNIELLYQNEDHKLQNLIVVKKV